MQKTKFKTITSFLLALTTNTKIVKIETSFLKIWYSCLNTVFFYYNYNIKFYLNYVPLCLKNFNHDYYFF